MKEKTYLKDLYESEISVTSIEDLEEVLLLDQHRKFNSTKISKERVLALELEILERKRGEL